MEKSVVFIEPAGHISNVFENYMRLPLMGSLYLGTILRNHGYDVRILNEQIRGRDVDPFEVRADVFCVTALTASANRAKLLAGQLRTVYPESKILVGGIHASLLPDEFTDIADHVVVGEAEDIIVDLVEGRIKEKVVIGQRVKDLEQLPLINYSLLEGFETMDIVPLMTSRGCPFDCSFCTVTKVFGRKFRMFSAERAVAELENAMRYFKTRYFFLYDDNFTANRQRVTAFCDLLIERRLDIVWAAQVRSDLAKSPDLVAGMARAGCRWLYIGFESIDDETLKSYHKSQTCADVVNAVQVFHRFGMNVHGMFMFGDHHDTLASIDRTVDFAVKHEIDTVQFMILTPFPGTRCYDDIVAEERLLHKNWDYYNGMFIVFRPANMSPAKLQTETYRAYRRFYSLRRTATDMLRMTSNVLFDALLWNMRRANTYRWDGMFIRAGARRLVRKSSCGYDAYVTFLGDVERRKVLDDNRQHIEPSQ